MLTKIIDAPGADEDFTLLYIVFKETDAGQLHVYAIPDDSENPINPYSRVDPCERADGQIYMHASAKTFAKKFPRFRDFVSYLEKAPEWKFTNKPVWVYVVRNYGIVFPHLSDELDE